MTITELRTATISELEGMAEGTASYNFLQQRLYVLEVLETLDGRDRLKYLDEHLNETCNEKVAMLSLRQQIKQGTLV